MYHAASTLSLSLALAVAFESAGSPPILDARDEARQLVVMVTCAANGQVRIGAGIIFDASESILHVATAEHIVDGCRGSAAKVSVRSRARPDVEWPAIVADQHDPSLNLAVLRAEVGVPAGVGVRPFDRLGKPDDMPRSGQRDQAVAITFHEGKAWHLNRAHDLRFDEQKPRLSYQTGGVDPGRSVRDPLASGHAGGALFTRADLLLVGMILKDEPTGGYLDGEALRIDVLLARLREWGFTVRLARPTLPDSFSAFAIGRAHMCGLAGAAYCWGDNDKSQLGNGIELSRTPRVLGRLSFVSLHAVADATCGMTTSGVIYCWGENPPGLFAEPANRLAVPRALPSGPAKLVKISVGGAHGCGLNANGAAYCWGDNALGQLGNGSGASSQKPILVEGGHRFAMIVAGRNHSCALNADGTAYCWGDNADGAVGNGSAAPAAKPVPVAGGRKFKSLSASRHTCGLSENGAVYCWGDNSQSQLGNATGGKQIRTPSVIAADQTFSAIAAGDTHTCAIAAPGAVYCWGSNSDGQLGVGKEPYRSDSPVRVLSRERFVEVRVGFANSDRGGTTCARTQQNAVFCWGEMPSTFPQGDESKLPVRIVPSSRL